MAEVIVTSLLVKLGDVLLQEAITLYGVTDKVESVKRELNRIRSFLKDADSKRNTGTHSEGIKTWVKEVREASFMIEDAIDKFLLKVEKNGRREPGFFNTVMRAARKPKELVAMHNLNSEIDTILNMLKEIHASKESYNIKELGENHMGNDGLHNRPPVVPEAHEIDLVGFGAERKEIIELLLDESKPKRSVVSIAGIPGLGKTALAEKIYQSDQVKNHFDVRIWLNVSQVYTRANLLRKILQKLLNIHDDNKYEEDFLFSKVNQLLREKRYFIVFDDVWDRDLWNHIEAALPMVRNASRVLLTTRFFEYAKAADPENIPFKLRHLTEEESLKLLFKKALPGENFSDGYPHGLREIAMELLRKCDGLPLALVVIGGLLSTKHRTTWDTVLSTLDWHTEADKCMKVLAASYEDLPVDLKSCFMYFASFPEDHEYNADLISWLWISEGFISQEKNCTLEQKAEKNLEELAQRCIIEISKKSLDGSMVSFHLHDLLLEIAIREAEEKDFLKVIREAKPSQTSVEQTSAVRRRATFQLKESSSDGTSFQESTSTKKISPIRTLISFGKVVPFSSQFKLLRVLAIFHYDGGVGDTFPTLLVSSLNKLLQLRCLAFTGCNFPAEVVLPVDRLTNLLVLVIKSCLGIVVPWSLWRIKGLRHVFVDSWGDSTLEGVSEPVDARNLQTLGQVIITRPGFGLLNINNLLKLHLTNEHDSWEAIVTLLGKLHRSLVSLTIESIVIPIEIINIKNFERLRALCLRGTWRIDGPLNADMFPPRLVMLTLISSHVDQELLGVLERVSTLNILKLEMAYVGRTMKCSKGGFAGLQTLILSMVRIEELQIEEGALAYLNHLEIHSCERLKTLPDLQNMQKLEVLSLRSMPKEFISKMQNEDKHKTEKIRYINIHK